MGGACESVTQTGPHPENLHENSPSPVELQTLPGLSQPSLLALILEVRMVTERQCRLKVRRSTQWSQTAWVQIPALPLAKLFSLAVKEVPMAPTAERWVMCSGRSWPQVNVQEMSISINMPLAAVPSDDQDRDYGSQKMPLLKDVHVPIPGTCEWVALSWQKGPCRCD